MIIQPVQVPGKLPQRAENSSIELETGYENARSQYLSSCPLPIAIGTDPLGLHQVQLDD